MRNQRLYPQHGDWSFPESGQKRFAAKQSPGPVKEIANRCQNQQNKPGAAAELLPAFRYLIAYNSCCPCRYTKGITNTRQGFHSSHRVGNTSSRMKLMAS